MLQNKGKIMSKYVENRVEEVKIELKVWKSQEKCGKLCNICHFFCKVSVENFKNSHF